MSEAAYNALRTDSDIGPLIESHGPIQLEEADDLFERLIISILRQQVSMASAAAIQNRLFEAVEVTPEGLLAAESSTLKDVGLSHQKTEYVQNVARVFDEHDYSKELFSDLSDDEVRDRLTSIKGVGEWTANMQLMFALGREDIFPVGDLGIRNGMWDLIDDELTEAEMVEYAERWRPYRSYAALYLWRRNDD